LPVLVLWLACSATAARAGDAAPSKIDFNRDVRPILSNLCFRCHGPDEGSRKAGLRLDRKDDAFRTLKSGSVAVAPGDLENSELYARITAEDNDPARMPPPDSGKAISPAQVAVLKRWIEQQAPWDEHWSFVPAVRRAVPEVKRADWPRTPIDRFVLAKLEAADVAPSPEADRVTFARRLHFDLLGRPPEVADVDAFLADPAPDAYERLVDRLLASPQYGERMAVAWLDLVRYADTVGYHSDVERSVSLYRDYVIRSFNADKPFDQFTVEQIAGDLLPNPTPWQRVASSYNMLGMTTEEGGAQAKEYLARYDADRVRNVGSVWMGATLGCAECHDHKYDPYTARDFYALAAFFADIRQKGVGTPKPNLAMPTPAQAARLARLDAKIARLDAASKMTARVSNAIPGRGTPPAFLARLGAAFKAELAASKKERAAIDAAVVRTVVPEAGKPRVIRVLARGDWQDESGDVVDPAVPGFMRPIKKTGPGRATRLDLARWLVAPDHPQTARVFVNRLWKLFFGAGLSDSLEDSGAQGDLPSHPELLDWLAVDFVESGWDVKRLVRMMVTSTAYRQSSKPRDDLLKVDPLNRLLARQGSFRLQAEFVRDNALAVSGLLTTEIGGASVRPYQPDGYWRFLNFPTRDYHPSEGADQYRRGLYTHWQRTLLHPSLLAFDAPSREFCTAKRPVSNTPQAALALLNDPTYVEAARALAAKALREGGAGDAPRLRWLWRRALAREPLASEQELLAALLGKERARNAADPAEARRLLAVGRSPVDPSLDPVELASWTSLARAVLNLDETITRD